MLVKLKINGETDFSRSKRRWSWSKSSCCSEFNYLQTRSTVTTGKKKVVGHILKLKTQLFQKMKQKKAILTSNMESLGVPLIDLELLQEASNSINKFVRTKHFKDELGKLKQKKKRWSKESVLWSLDPFINSKSILRVGEQIIYNRK